jgi:hypothetical protein
MIESDYFLSARSRRAKSHPDINLSPESFAAHIALQPIQGYPFPPPMFIHEAYEFEAFDHLEQAVADWRALFNPLEGNLTTAILDVPELKSETWENFSVPDIVMLSSSGDFGKWNFGFEVQVGWDKQLSSPASQQISTNPFGSPIPRLPTPQSEHSEGSVMFHFTYEAGRYTIRTGWTCPWCEKGSFGSLDALQQHLTFCHELFHFRVEVDLLMDVSNYSGVSILRRIYLLNSGMITVRKPLPKRAWMRGCSRTSNLKERREISKNISRTESLRRGSTSGL